ncbi:LysR family transcriptional regulator [uncultured Ruegeria sp.]|uniref:LysR family transcriptional regulator n=1 Tax=uncultured Ruegeria sp. TaxID=259304 RepID=UPI00262BD48C|nr:LysR family transcriptional regulator [uncultured Ruegeria sp.]
MRFADIWIGVWCVFEQDDELHLFSLLQFRETKIATVKLKIESAISASYSARMQRHDWNDLKYLLALHREGKLIEAGRKVGVSDTTVARRIKMLEEALATTLFLRSANGRYEPTDAALQILSHAESIEASHAAISAISGESTNRVSGSVRLSAVPVIVNRFLVTQLPLLTRLHPDLSVELVPSSDNLDLSKREADLSVRFARPSDGGMRTKAQKLGEVSFVACAAKSISPEHYESLGWITYDEAHSRLPQARWLESTANSEDLRAGLRVTDVETALQAVVAGIGKTLLPRAVVLSDPRLQAIEPEDCAKFPSREVWMLSHVNQTSRVSITAVKEWLMSLSWH